MGIRNNIFKAMAPPSISASEVAIEARIAKERKYFDIFGPAYIVVASERHRPVAIPRWATLC